VSSDETRRDQPKGCIKAGIPVGGVLPDDMRRGGGLQWPPAGDDPWEAMQGLVLSAGC
jgi:hypothetical protein